MGRKNGVLAGTGGIAAPPHARTHPLMAPPHNSAAMWNALFTAAAALEVPPMPPSSLTLAEVEASLFASASACATA